MSVSSDTNPKIQDNACGLDPEVKFPANAGKEEEEEYIEYDEESSTDEEGVLTEEAPVVEETYDVYDD